MKFALKIAVPINVFDDVRHSVFAQLMFDHDR